MSAKSTKEALMNTHRKLHALEHLLAGLVRKYGDDHKSALLTPLDYEGNHAVTITVQGENALLELHEPDPCPCGQNEGQAS